MAGTLSQGDDTTWVDQPPSLAGRGTSAATDPGRPPAAAPEKKPVRGRLPIPRRRHPSRGARAVALASSVAATVTLGAAMARADQSSAATQTLATPSASVTASSTSGSSAGSATAASSGAYTDGTYTGAVETIPWGNVQVSVTVTGGKIASVTEVQVPSDGKSAAINERAQPVLQSEAIAAQSANLDVVSGATYTSKSYMASLQAALDQAAQGATTPTTTSG